MKKILLLWLFSSSLDGFSQDKIDSVQILDKLVAIFRNDTLTGYVRTPDTLRATLIVYHDGEASIVHTKAGFVVMQYGKEDVYLDDRQHVIKYPLVVLTYKIRRASK